MQSEEDGNPTARTARRHAARRGQRAVKSSRRGGDGKVSKPRPAAHKTAIRARLSREKWQAIGLAMNHSPRQLRVVQLMIRGKKHSQIAASLGLSVATVRTYLKRIYARLCVSDRVELAIRAWQALTMTSNVQR